MELKDLARLIQEEHKRMVANKKMEQLPMEKPAEDAITTAEEKQFVQNLFRNGSIEIITL